MATDNIISLLDLQVESGCTISPYVWRIKYALRHKGFDIDVIPNGFTGIEEITDGFSNRVPVIKDDGVWIKDSWNIADYLDAQYPDRPMLYEGESQALLTRFIDGWMWQTIIHPWFLCYIKDYHDHALERDRPYVRESRERMFLGGRRIEDVAEGREQRLPEAVPLLQPLRSLLGTSKWLGGDKPLYVDYCVLSTFLWCGSIATIPPMHDDEPLRDWIERGLDLFDGLGRHPGMHPLFGLPGTTPQPRMPG